MTPEISDWLSRFQNQVTDALESFAPSEPFQRDPWQRNAETSLQGYGETRILEHGSVFERAGVGLSRVKSAQLPPAATKNRPELIGQPFRAMGVSVVVHPRNPYAPTAHLNVRCLQAGPEDAPLATWFGGGFDLTPYYGFEEDARHWHECAQIACSVAGETAYPKFKAECDQYFYLPHRQEARGIGGIFFDDYGEDNGFALIQNVGAQFLAAYVPIVARRASTPYGERERAWQLYRRGRYVEFNLVHDRGTHFGLQSGGRTESILLSMPPLVTWAYQHQPEAHSPEAKLLSDFLPIRNWI